MTARPSEVTWAEVVAAVAAIDPEAISAARWYGDKGRSIERIEPAEAFDLGGGAGLAIVEIHTSRYLVALLRSADAVRIADPGDGAWRALAIAIAEGRTIPAIPRGVTTQPGPSPVRAALVCRPARGLRRGAGEVAELEERPLGADQSNTSVVLGEQLLLKAYRRLEIGLNPDLELNALLDEEVGFDGVPALAGYAEVVTAGGAATVAILQEFVVDGVDAYEATAEQLAAWILAPGEVSVEFATEIAAEMGALTASLHAALASATGFPGFEVRDATRDELRSWRRDAQRQLQRAIDAVGATPGPAADELRAMAPAIAEQLTVLEAIPTVPLVTRVHGDLHLGQVLLTLRGPRIVDFEGEPLRPIDERRRPTSPLRDAASMLRSLDHAGRSARRRAERRRGGPVELPGLDLDAWLHRARVRFVDAYRRGLREAGVPIAVDDDLLRAFEFEKESYEFVYAATWLPDWLWAPLEGMQALVAEAAQG